MEAEEDPPPTGAEPVSSIKQGLTTVNSLYYSIRALSGTGNYVTARFSASLEGTPDYGRMMADSTTIGSWQNFSLHTTDKGATLSLRNKANLQYVIAELGAYTGTYDDILRVRGAYPTGSWARFGVTSYGGGVYALKSDGDLQYASARITSAGEVTSVASTVGSWEKFQISPIGTAPALPSTTSITGGTVRVMSWNVARNITGYMGDHNTATYVQKVVNGVKAAFPSTAPDAVFLQEYCELEGDDVVNKLVAAYPGTTWKAYFAPYHFMVNGLPAAQMCPDVTATEADRGSFGVGLVVKTDASNPSNWSRQYILSSPSGVQQRPVVCTILEGRRLFLCSTHFSSGCPQGSCGMLHDDDSNCNYRTNYQVPELKSIADGAASAGYRPIFGGDLNVSPPDDLVNNVCRTAATPLYDAYKECAQADYGSRNGDKTFPSGTPTRKIDYIFAPSNATFNACTVMANTDSDHRPIYGTITLP
jgi:endonuclease/exonuclease/phosphatase family metal-dependent hydrolase